MTIDDILDFTIAHGNLTAEEIEEFLDALELLDDTTMTATVVV